MSTWIFIIGLMFVVGAMTSRLQRRQDRGEEPAKLRREIRVAKLWGFDAEREEKAYREEIAEQNRWSNNVEFELGNGAAIAVGVVLWLIAAAVWSGEDETHTAGHLWDLIWRFAGYGAAGAFLLAWMHGQLKRLDKVGERNRLA